MTAISDVSLVREGVRPEVYLICGGTKLRIPQTEFERVGFNAKRVRAVPDGTLARYPEKSFAPPAAVRPSDVFFDCGDDWEGPLGKYHRNCQSSASLVRKDVLLAGRLELGQPWANVKPYGCEDAFFNVWLDPTFITRMYGPGGLSTALVGRFYPGNPRSTAVPVEDHDDDGGSRGVNVNSFQVTSQFAVVHGELNCWHVDTTGEAFGRHFVGRGAPPSGWVKMSVGGTFEGAAVRDDEAWFPWDIFRPGGEPVRGGDYVLMRGALWQDHAHDTATNPWEHGATVGHGGWTEFHPVDWIVTLSPPPVSRRATVTHVGLCTEPDRVQVQRPDAYPWRIAPDFPPSEPTRQLSLRSIEAIVDNRGGFTDRQTVLEHRVVPSDQHADVFVAVRGKVGRQGRFLASYVPRWRETDSLDRNWVNDALPGGAVPGGEREAWNWIDKQPPGFTGARAESEAYIGTRAHRSARVAGRHQHSFTRATERLDVSEGDVLFAHVFLDPAAPPTQVMLQWNDGSWEHRAYWGENRIAWGADGTASRRRMGDLPAAREWVRLEVPAALVGLEGRSLSGMAFTLYGGRATWDCAGKRVPQRVPPECAGLREQRAAKAAEVAGLKRSLSELQEQLNQAPPGEKPALREQIAETRAAIAAAAAAITRISAEITRLGCP